MIVCVTSDGASAESLLDPRFGRCSYFIFHDTETGKDEAVENVSAKAGGGAGVSSGQLMVEKCVEAVITGNVGPNAMNVLKAGGIGIYRGETVSVRENINKFISGKLQKISDTVESHFGMKGMGGR